MTAPWFASSVDPDGRAVSLPRDTAARLHGLLVSRRDQALVHLERVAPDEDPSPVDDHAEISAMVATDTLHGIENALSRFEAGKYGSCEICAAAIAIERLEGIPHATTCVTCAAIRSSSA